MHHALHQCRRNANASASRAKHHNALISQFLAATPHTLRLDRCKNACERGCSGAWGPNHHPQPQPQPQQQQATSNKQQATSYTSTLHSTCNATQQLPVPWISSLKHRWSWR